MVQLLYLHVRTCLCYDLVGFVLQMWSVFVGINIISVFSSSIKLRMVDVNIGTLTLPCFEYCGVQCICNTFSVGKEKHFCFFVLFLATVNLIVEDCGEKYLNSQLLLRTI